MRILILGGTGMLGHRLWMHLGKAIETWVTCRSSPDVFPDWPEFDKARVLGHVDALNFDGVARALATVRPDLVINCIGLIKQLPLAHEPLSAIQLNSVLPHRLALICRVAGSRLIHISTDCVFSGTKGNYVEDDPSDATDLYGKTKFLGEVSYPHTITLRTSIIGRELKSRVGLIEWFLSQTQIVKGYTRAIYTGLTTDEFSRVIINHIIPNPEINGVYHISSAAISKYDLLCLVNQAFERGITIEQEPNFVCDRSLDSRRFRKRTGYNPPTWPEMVEELATTSSRYNTLR